MNEFVGVNGQAGWGTWCVREFLPQEEEEQEGEKHEDEEGDQMMSAVLASDSEKTTKNSTETDENHQAQQPRQPKKGNKEVVKVFCWGEVVGEIWLALFIGSKRKIKGTGARWVDASGEAVVVMR